MNATGWISNRGQPEYFNSCVNINGPTVPYNNLYGYQQAFSGQGYFGIQTYFNASSTNFREYFGCKLGSNLILGTKYYLTCRVSCAFGGNKGYNLGANNLGARLSTTIFTQSNPIPVDNYSQILFDTLITDTLNWTLLSGSFVADSVYKYISFGNFYDDAHTTIMAIGPVGTRAAYYFDNICLSTDSAYASTWTGIKTQEHNNSNAILLSPNPSNSFVKISTEFPFEKLEVYDLQSKLIFSKTINENNYSLDISNYAEGLYFLKIMFKDGELKTSKLVKQ